MSLLYSCRLLMRNGQRLLRPQMTASTEHFCMKLPKLASYHLGSYKCRDSYSFNSNWKLTRYMGNNSLYRTFSLNSKPPLDTDDASNDSEKNLTVFQRFKKVYKEYGKTLIAVHVVTSIVWYGGFYVLAKSGIDLLPLLVKFGFSEAIQAKYLAAGDFLVAYLIYEITKPIRYLFTIGATQQTIKYMRKTGYLPPIEPGNKLRNLAKDSRDNIRGKYQEQKVDMKERYSRKKEEYIERWDRARLARRMKRSRKYGIGHRHNGSHSYRFKNKTKEKRNGDQPLRK